MIRPRLALGVASLLILALSACAPAQAENKAIIDSGQYVALYQETISDFPEELPSGVSFPEEPPEMTGDIGRGNAAGMAYFFWACAWEDVYLSSQDPQQRDIALRQLRAFPNTEWGSQYYEDPDGVWGRVLDAAELGDLTELRQFYQSDCQFYRSAK